MHKLLALKKLMGVPMKYICFLVLLMIVGTVGKHGVYGAGNQCGKSSIDNEVIYEAGSLYIGST